MKTLTRLRYQICNLHMCELWPILLDVKVALDKGGQIIFVVFVSHMVVGLLTT